MKQTKRFFVLALAGASLFAGMATVARADDDGWGRIPISVVVGVPTYGAQVYMAPRPVAHGYYGAPQGYYHHEGRSDHRDWRDHRD